MVQFELDIPAVLGPSPLLGDSPLAHRGALPGVIQQRLGLLIIWHTTLSSAPIP